MTTFPNFEIPKYISNPTRENILDALSQKKFPTITHSDEFYSIKLTDDFLQGDILKNLPFIEIIDKNPKFDTANVMILSNSCSISEENEKIIPSEINFGKIIDLGNLVDSFKKNGVDDQRIEQILEMIRKNLVFNIFYLPEFSIGDNTIRESIVRFDKINSFSQKFLKNYSPLIYPAGDKIMALSQKAFFLLLIKLAIYFCRMSEGIDRDNLEHNNN